MKEDFENIDGLFANELKDFSPSPPIGMWENIEQKLPQKQAKKTSFLFYKVAASLALLLSAGSLGIYLFTHSPEQQQPITSEIMFNETPAEIIPDSKAPENEVNKKKSPNISTTEQSNITDAPPITRSTSNTIIEGLHKSLEGLIVE